MPRSHSVMTPPTGERDRREANQRERLPKADYQQDYDREQRDYDGRAKGAYQALRGRASPRQQGPYAHQDDDEQQDRPIHAVEERPAPP